VEEDSAMNFPFGIKGANGLKRVALDEGFIITGGSLII